MVMARSWENVRAQARATGKLDEARVVVLGAKLRAEARAYRLLFSHKKPPPPIKP